MGPVCWCYANCPLGRDTVREALPDVRVIAVSVEQSSIVQWPKVSWLLNCALALSYRQNVTALWFVHWTWRILKGSLSNEMYKLVCVVLIGELTFGVILGKLKQEWMGLKKWRNSQPVLVGKQYRPEVGIWYISCCVSVITEKIDFWWRNLRTLPLSHHISLRFVSMLLINIDVWVMSGFRSKTLRTFLICPQVCYVYHVAG
jgi:hypothetical protein